MITRIKGKLVKKEENRVVINVGEMFYEVNIPRTVYHRLPQGSGAYGELVIYHYFSIEKNRGIPVMIGFIDELEKDFFEKFIGVAGIGPKVALKAFDKPISLIAKAIEEADIGFLKTLAGIGMQKAKHIVAHLQGRVGRFALIKEEEGRGKGKPVKKEVVEEAKEVLRRLQYSAKESLEMVEKALEVSPAVESVEDLLNEIYRQRK